MGRRGQMRRMQQQAPQVKGFRPGKAPKELRKNVAKQAMGDMTKAQERMVDLFADRSPEESVKLIGRWVRWSLIGGLLLSALGVLAFTWTWIAGVPLLLASGFVLFNHFRLRAQRTQLEEMAAAVAKVTGGR